MAGVVDRVGERRRVAARRQDDDEVSARLEVERPATKRENELSEPVAVLGAGRCVDQPAVPGRTLARPSSVDVAGDGRLDDVVAGARSASASSVCVEIGALARGAGSRPGAPFGLRHGRARRRGSPARGRRRLGDDERRRQAEHALAGGPRRPARPRGTPRRPARRGGRARTRREALGRGPRGRRPAIGARSAAPRRRPRRAEELIVERVADGASGGARDRVAAERRGVVAGLEPARGLVGHEQSADRQPVRKALRQRDESGLIPSCSWAKNVPVRPRPHWISSVEEQAGLCGERGRCLEEGGRSRMDSALALDGLEEDAGDVAVGAGGRQRLRVVQAGEADVGRAARTRLASPADPSSRAPKVRPWNEPSSATRPVCRWPCART